jgi:WD40 repeat protein
MDMNSVAKIGLFLLICCLISISLLSCQPSQNSAETAAQDESSLPVKSPAPIETPATAPASVVIVPSPLPTEEPVEPLLAYLRDGDLWLYDFGQKGEVQLTTAGDITAFAWSPDGEQIAYYALSQLCVMMRGGHLFAEPACRPLPPAVIPDDYAPSLSTYQIRWSADGQHVLVFFNEWWVINLLDPSQDVHIADPLDLELDDFPRNIEGPASFAGDALFLPDGSIVGTVTHVYFCGSGGCEYQLYQLDGDRLAPPPAALPAVMNGARGLTMSADGRFLANYGAFHVGCAFYTTYINLTNLQTGERRAYQYEQRLFHDMRFSPDGEEAVVVQIEGCGSAETTKWSDSCGLGEVFEVLPMQLWDWSDDTHQDLVPGLEPSWSPDGQSIAFRSCLAQSPAGTWEPITKGPPWIYSLQFTEDGYAIIPIAVGAAPAWQPHVP